MLNRRNLWPLTHKTLPSKLTISLNAQIKMLCIVKCKRGGLLNLSFLSKITCKIERNLTKHILCIFICDSPIKFHLFSFYVTFFSFYIFHMISFPMYSFFSISFFERTNLKRIQNEKKSHYYD